MNSSEQTVQCCFCGNAIVQIEPDPLTLTLAVEEGSEQELFCHYPLLEESC